MARFPRISPTTSLPRGKKAAGPARDRGGPVPRQLPQMHFSAEAMKAHVDGQHYTVPVQVAGRRVTIRDIGKSQFVKFLDQPHLRPVRRKRNFFVGHRAG